MKKSTLFAGLSLSIGMIFFACKMDTDLGINSNAKRPLYPQNPLSPQVTLISPQAYERVGDSFYIKFSVKSGRTWWGGPDNLAGYKVLYDWVTIDSAAINGKSFTYEKSVTTGKIGTHSVDVIVYSKSGYSGSQGIYISKF